MQRRPFLVASGALLALPTWAHHGWSSFDQNRPIYLEGKARKVVWRTRMWSSSSSCRQT